MPSTPSDPNPSSDVPREPARRRRRRNAEATTTPREDESNGSSRRPDRVWFPASWGLTPTFRVFLFLSAIVAVMAFLLYNEYLIRQVREQERDRAELYANLYGLAVTEALPPETSADIFDRIIINPSIDLPLIVSNHRGEIILHKGTGLTEEGDSLKARRQLQEMMAGMDAVNRPVRAHWITQARGRIYIDTSRVIVTDPSDYAMAWAGADLPPFEEGTRVPDRVAVIRQQMAATGHPIDFSARTAVTCYLARDGEEFVLIEAGRTAPLVWHGEGLPAVSDTSRVASHVVRSRYDALAAQQAPMAFQLHTEHVIHFGDTELLSRISLAPVVTLGVLCLFGLIGYVGFRNMRRSEQRSIWVGMAKETAHQLGTPLSSLSGWLELIQQRLQDASDRENEDLEAVASMAGEMQRDMGRLNQIASRFSQIGSTPELRPGDMAHVITDTINYFRGRGSQFGRHTFEADVSDLPQIPLNAELMGWVFENLFKNAIDAMIGQEGQIRVSAHHDEEHEEIILIIEDSGRGIKTEHLSRVFEPGFSTKKRGWGLGLAFVKRIIEEYHCGRIQVGQSEAGQGTSFEIALPTN